MRVSAPWSEHNSRLIYISSATLITPSPGVEERVEEWALPVDSNILRWREVSTCELWRGSLEGGRGPWWRGRATTRWIWRRRCLPTVISWPGSRYQTHHSRISPSYLSSWVSWGCNIGKLSIGDHSVTEIENISRIIGHFVVMKLLANCRAER